MKPAARPSLANLLWLPPLLFLALFYFFPLASILQTSFARGQSLAAPFLEAFTSPAIQRVIAFTFWQAALSTLLTLLFGLPGAYLMARYRFRGKSLILALTAIPFVMPTLVVAAAFTALLGPRGWVNLALMSWLGLPQPPIAFANTLAAILVAHIFYNTTIVLRMVGDFWSHLDPRLTQAAEVLGAGRWRALRQVTLPLHPAGGALRRPAGLHLRLHLLRRDPHPGRTALRHAGGGDLQPDGRAVQPAPGSRLVCHPARLHPGADRHLLPAHPAHLPPALPAPADLYPEALRLLAHPPGCRAVPGGIGRLPGGAAGSPGGALLHPPGPGARPANTHRQRADPGFLPRALDQPPRVSLLRAAHPPPSLSRWATPSPQSCSRFCSVCPLPGRWRATHLLP